MEAHLTDVTRVIQLAVAPVFLLTSVAAIIGALNTRLGRIVDRRRVLQERLRGCAEADERDYRAELLVLSIGVSAWVVGKIYRVDPQSGHILKMIMDESFSTVTLKRMRRDRADYTIVQKINTRLDEITSAITKNNRAFDLMKTIEEIRGLLLDLKF